MADFHPERVSLWDYLKARLAQKLPGLPASWSWDQGQWQQWQRAVEQRHRSQGASPQAPEPPELLPPPEEPVHPTAVFPKPDPAQARTWLTAGLLLLVMGLALMAQVLLHPPRRLWGPALVLYAMALGLWLWHWHRQDQPPPVPDPWEAHPWTVRTGWLWLGLPASLAAFWLFGGNRYTGLNLTLWGFGFLAFWAAFWPTPPQQVLVKAFRALARPTWVWRVTPLTLALLAALLVAVGYRTYRLTQVPAEMFSDHAEKLYDVMDVLDGQWRIFFPRNTGREDFQMYLTAFIAKVAGTGISFISLKLGTVLMGLLMLPYLYLLGRELGYPWIGVASVLLAGLAYWPNVQARVALRFILYPAFVAPTLYHLLRAARRGRPQDFLLAGVFLGWGLHGYSPFRLVPLTVLMALALAWWYHKGTRRWALAHGLALTVVFATLVFLPLLRYMLAAPEIFFYRSMTRLGQVERPYPGNPLVILVQETFQALVMPWWDNGNIWVHSVPGHPALSLVSGAWLALGLTWALWRWWHWREWSWGVIVLSVPLLMLPSILSLAFPEENPSLNRSAGAVVPVFLLAGAGLVQWTRGLVHQMRQHVRVVGMGVVVLVVGLLLYIDARHNAVLVFQLYDQNFRQSAWNTSELGRVISGFARSVGHPDRAWVIPYPHWVDTRLVGIRAGYPRKDYALPRERLHETLQLPTPKLFLFKPEDQETLNRLWELYPQGRLWRYRSPTPGKDFMVFYVP